VEQSLFSKAAGHRAVKEIFCIYRTYKFIIVITPCFFHINISKVVITLQFLQQTFCTSCLRVQCCLRTVRPPVLWLNLAVYLANSHAISVNLPNKECDVPSAFLFFPHSLGCLEEALSLRPCVTCHNILVFYGEEFNSLWTCLPSRTVSPCLRSCSSEI